MIIGVLGGSFCPPTNAHIELSKKCIEAGLCDKVIWVPVNDAYRKSTNISAKHRCAMVDLALKGEANITYSLHEQNHKDIIRTLPSLKELQKLYPNDELRFIAGADKLAFKWIQKEEFVSNFGLILTDRDDVDCEALIARSDVLSKYRNKIHLLKYKSSVSSTEARNDIHNAGRTTVIPAIVMKYINDNNLFI